MVELLSVKENQLLVKGLDAIDGTHIIDIKSVMKEFLPKRNSYSTRMDDLINEAILA